MVSTSWALVYIVDGTAMLVHWLYIFLFFHKLVKDWLYLFTSFKDWSLTKGRKYYWITCAHQRLKSLLSSFNNAAMSRDVCPRLEQATHERAFSSAELSIQSGLLTNPKVFW